MIYVITGSYTQAKDWISKDVAIRKSLGQDFSMSEYCYVHDASSLAGVRNPRGVFTGTWKKRGDIVDILTKLIVSMDETHPSLKVIQQMWFEVNTQEY